MSDRATFKVEESRRLIVSVTGHRETFHNVIEIDVGGNWNRFKCDEGYVLVNPENVLCIIVEGDKVR